ncbi:hypothetical protein HPB49_000722 [Dermacentor silvarum]|uniref:Uncharacterized protein n=1 Tax=Dermacentor silvarum TaxID=543639 RepID=A0ACB8DLJ9_DERSI|nr:hypothetical protein HPB49_000722 [Dermacentor silvarum]
MINSTHRLTGFGSLLEGRRVPFVEPLPSQRVCCVCDVVSSVTKKLPCCHVLCNGPCGRAFEMRDGRDCPVDGYKTEENEVVVVTSALVDLEQFEVFCINRACDFKGTLRLMMEHFLLCEYGEGIVRQMRRNDDPRSGSPPRLGLQTTGTSSGPRDVARAQRGRAHCGGIEEPHRELV